MSSEEFFRTKEKIMEGKTYTDLSELVKDIQTTSRKIDGISSIANSSDIEDVRKRKQPCQYLVFLEVAGKKYSIALSSETTAGWYH